MTAVCCFGIDISTEYSIFRLHINSRLYDENVNESE